MLTSASNHSYWIGYQVLFGAGIGLGFQTSTLACQTVLPRVDVPLGLALTFFAQQLGGSVFLAAAQNTFSSELIHRLSGVTGLDPQKIVNTGATDLRKVVPKDELGLVVSGYNYALTRVFVLAAALSAFMIVGALAMEWKNIKGKNGIAASKEPAAAELEKCEK